MAYKTSELKELAMKAIKKNKLFFIEDILAMLSISTDTFYRHFPKESKDYKEITDGLKENKINVRVALRKKWWESDHPKTQELLYKLSCPKNELDKLTYKKTENTNTHKFDKEIEIKVNLKK